MNEFRDAIARITIESTEVRGTGFLVAPDLIATALHVVANRETEPATLTPFTISLHFQGRIGTDFEDRTITAEILKTRLNQDADCVLLKCAEPLDGYPIIPLRELNESGGLWRTRGYPDAQPVDGTTWDGDVTAEDERLTTSYETRDVPYEPVLQLFCKQAGSGTGAPPKGMSGAPVLVGTAAVGLLRYALMEDGKTVAATLYACSARDIMELWPERLKLRPALILAASLTEPQALELNSLLAAVFPSVDELRWVIQYSMGVSLPSSTEDSKTFVPIVLRTLLQLGPGTVDVLLRGVITARPDDQGLRAFAEKNFEYALEPLDDDEGRQDAHDKALVTAISLTLIALTKNPAKMVHTIIGRYRPGFEQMGTQIETLAKYKKLHDCLHEVQKLLNDVEADIDRLKEGKIAARYLKQRAATLDDLARNARKQITGLPSETEEKEWIDDLAARAKEILISTDANASPADREKIVGVPKGLRRILRILPEINTHVVDTARRVQLDDFADTMRSVEKELGGNLSPQSLEDLHTGCIAVGRLRSRLAGLVAEHNEWQLLNNELEVARNQPFFQPQAKFQSWKAFRARIVTLCDIAPQEEWSTALKETIKDWGVGAIPPEPEFKATKDQLGELFQNFYDECVARFIAVDKELNALCKRVTDFKVPIDALLVGADAQDARE